MSLNIRPTLQFLLKLKQTASGYIWNYETANIHFGTDNIQRMVIAGTTGHVGIGTSTSLAARLHLYDSSDNILQIQFFIFLKYIFFK